MDGAPSVFLMNCRWVKESSCAKIPLALFASAVVVCIFARKRVKDRVEPQEDFKRPFIRCFVVNYASLKMLLNSQIHRFNAWNSFGLFVLGSIVCTFLQSIENEFVPKIDLIRLFNVYCQPLCHWSVHCAHTHNVHRCCVLFFCLQSYRLNGYEKQRNEQNKNGMQQTTTRDNESIKKSTTTISSAMLFDIFMRCWHKQEYVRQHTYTRYYVYALMGKHISRQTERQTYQRKKHTHTVIYSHVSHNLQAVANWIERQEKRQETTGTEINRSCSLRCWLRKSVR